MLLSAELLAPALCGRRGEQAAAAALRRPRPTCRSRRRAGEPGLYLEDRRQAVAQKLGRAGSHQLVQVLFRQRTVRETLLSKQVRRHGRPAADRRLHGPCGDLLEADRP